MFDKIFKLMRKLKKEYAEYPYAISDEIFCLNGNDGEKFDWDANGRCCEFCMFYKTYKDPTKFDKEEPSGAIKLCINQDGTYDAYIYNKCFENPEFDSFDEKKDVYVNKHFRGDPEKIHNEILKYEDKKIYDFKLEESRKI